MWENGEIVRFIGQTNPKMTLLVAKSYTVYSREEYSLYPTSITIVVPLDGSEPFETESINLEFADMSKDWVHATTGEWEERIRKETFLMEKDEYMTLTWKGKGKISYSAVMWLSESTLPHKRLQWYMPNIKCETYDSLGDHKERDILKAPESFYCLTKVVGRFIRAVAANEKGRLTRKRKEENRVKTMEQFEKEQIEEVQKVYGIKYIP